MIYLGIDPGAKGGLVALSSQEKKLGGVIKFSHMPDTEYGIIQWFRAYSHGMEGIRILGRPVNHHPNVVALIEEIPSAAFGWDKSSMSKLYGSYMALRMALTSCNIRFHTIKGRAWHKAMGIRSKKKTEDQTDFKNRLKREAEKRFPELVVTLAVADALLLAKCCQSLFPEKIQKFASQGKGKFSPLDVSPISDSV